MMKCWNVRMLELTPPSLSYPAMAILFPTPRGIKTTTPISLGFGLKQRPCPRRQDASETPRYPVQLNLSGGGLAVEVNITFNPVHIALLSSDSIVLHPHLIAYLIKQLGGLGMSFLSGRLGCAKFSYPIKTMHYVDSFRLHTSKVLLSAFFRVSILR